METLVGSGSSPGPKEPGVVELDYGREALISGLVSGGRGGGDLQSFLIEALTWFDSLGERRQEELGASTLARLEPFVANPIIRNILTRPQSLDIADMIAKHKILIVNLEIGRPLLIDRQV